MIEKTEKEIMKNWQGDISEPVVSICCITYNHEQYISEAINSFLMQETNFPFEIVIGEDCSTDNTRKIVEKYKEMYPNIIKLIVSENNVGMQKNGIRTLKACKGQYIAFCEGDDYWTNNKKLDIQISYMMEYKDCDMSIHYSSAYDVSTSKIFNKWTFKKDKFIYKTEDVLSTSSQFASTSSYIITRRVINKYKNIFYNELPVGDFFTEFYASLSGGILYLPYNMSTYRVNVFGSWSESNVKNYSDIRALNYYTDMEIILKNMRDNFPIFTQYINKKISSICYGKALYYLCNNKFNEFQQNINEAYLLDKDIHVFKKIIYYCKKAPLIAKYIFNLKNKIK